MSDESHSDTNRQPTTRRRPSQHCSVYLGAVFSSQRYQIVRKLGQGVHSIVWLARDRELNRYVALKITKSKSDSSSQELKILQHLSAESRPQPGKKRVLALLDSFEHHAPTGTHECFVFEVMGPCVRSYIKDFESVTAQPGSILKGSRENTKVRLSEVKSILRQVLLGLDFLHKRGILHNDLHPGNILLSIKGLQSIEEFTPIRHDREAIHSLTISGQIRQKIGHSFQDDQPRKASGSNQRNSKRLKVSHTVTIKNEVMEKRSLLKVKSLDKVKRPNTTARKDSRSSRLASPPPFDGAINLLSPIRIKISDMGGAFFLSDPPDHPKTPHNIRSPEMILGCSINQSQDIWTVGCLIFELITGRALFMVNARDSNASDDECSTTEEADNSESGKMLDASADFLEDGEENKQAEVGLQATTEEDKHCRSNPAISQAPSRDTSYFQQFACRIGPLPPFILSNWPKSSHFFEQDGKSKSRSLNSPPWPSLEAHFDDQPPRIDVSSAEKVALFDLIYYIMKYDPEKRPSARQILRHSWFLGVDDGET